MFSIFGSCVTRDAFASTAKDPRLDLYIARSSLWSIVAEPLALLGPIPEPGERVTPFERRMVEWDVTKASRALLAGSGAKTLIVDLIDERFDVIQDGAGLATESASFRKLGLQDALGANAERLSLEQRLGSVDVMAARFAALIAGRFDRVVIHRAFWALSSRDGETVVPMERGDFSVRVNGAIAAVYDALQRAIPEAQVVELPEDLRVADPLHRWGLAPFHFEPAYYAEFRRLVGID